MFGFLYELMAGMHDELPRRQGPRLTFDPAAGGFVEDEDRPARDGGPQRGEIPGAPLAAAAKDPAGPSTIAEEVKKLVQPART